MVEKYIYKQLNNSLTKFERQQFRQLVSRFIKDKKLDAVILGCTELPLVYGDNDDPAIIDTLKVLCDGLLRGYFKNK
ncbi:MAG: hypothetical protein WCP03_03345 [Candidatus Saccharibacteria bacterium]